VDDDWCVDRRSDMKAKKKQTNKQPKPRGIGLVY
jgi:hypothetical protein